MTHHSLLWLCILYLAASVVFLIPAIFLGDPDSRLQLLQWSIVFGIAGTIGSTAFHVARAHEKRIARLEEELARRAPT